MYKKYIVGLLCTMLAVYADEADQQDISNFINGVKQAPSTVESMGTGIAQSFGMGLGDAYKESFAIVNDTSKYIFAGKRSITNAQGINAFSSMDQLMIINPYKDSGTSFYNSQLRCGIVVDYDSSYGTDTGKYKNKVGISQSPSVKYYKNETDPGDPTQQGYHDPYVIRAYNRQDNLNVEFLSQVPTDTNFTGVFYNNSSNDVKLTFVKDGGTYNVTLEARSFNNLESSADVTNSIRPPLQPSNQTRNFIFSGSVSKTIPIPAAGYIGAPYTYEIYNGTINIQGLGIGNYDQIPVDAQGNQAPTRVRDINPIPCSFWYKTIDQSQPSDQSTQNQSKQQQYIEPYPIWIAYKTKDQRFVKKLTPGKSNDIALIRPQLSEGQATLFGIVVQTKDDTKAQTFINRVLDGAIKVSTDRLTPQPADTSSAITMVPNTLGLINDNGSGGTSLTGYLLLLDVFMPIGIGSSTLYYSFDPAIIGVDQLAYLFMPYLNVQAYTVPSGQQIQDVIMADLMNNIPDWINQYQTNKSTDGVKRYLQSKGSLQLFSDQAHQTFNDFGNQILNSLTTGKVSIANYPVLRSAGSNNFMTPPDGFDKLVHQQL